MATTTKWSALGTYTTLIPGATTAPTLKNLASAAAVLGSEIDPTGASDRHLYAYLELLCRFISAPGSAAYCEVYWVTAVDGTNYADGDASTVPPTAALVASFPVRAVTTQQRITIPFPVQVPAVKFKPLLRNLGGQNFTNTDNENVLSYRPVDLAAV